jgi:UDP-N-acetylmuramoyl-tripeptide--D-alanyl-D-alanine ligase
VNIKLSEIYALFDAKEKAPVKDMDVAGICTDSRKLKKGEVFIALNGDIMDGHKFAAAAEKKGAAAVIVEKNVPGIRKQIMVKDTKKAIMNLGRYFFKKHSKIRVAAVTGSNGKTTTKEILSAMLAVKYKVRKSEKSFNNYLGLPLTLFGLEKRHQALVAEIGMNHAGEISLLVSLIEIDAAIITNVGRAHVGNFRNIRGIASAKAEIFEGVRKGGCACLNADDKFYDFLKKKAEARGIRTQSFSINAKSDFRSEFIKEDDGKTVFDLHCSGKKTRMVTYLKGVHNLSNIAAAAAAASTMCITPAQMKKALAVFKMEGLMRFEEKDIRGVRVINDMYNANPDSFTASINALKSMKTNNLIVIAGDMLELGKNSAAFHKEIGGKLAALKLKKLLIYGKFSGDMKRGFSDAAGKNEAVKAVTFRDKELLKKALASAAVSGDIVFIKGSRGNKLEEVLEAIGKTGTK